MPSELKGVMPAIASPCDENDRFLEDVYARLIQSLYEAGVHGLYACGMTGDGYKMRIAERKRAAQIAAELSKRYKGTLIVHVGTWDTRSAMELAEHAAEIGADAVASIPPAHSTQRQIVSYYADVAHAAGIPVLVYHIPEVTKTVPTLDELLELLDIEGVVGLKLTDWNQYTLKRLMLARPGTTIFSGYDEVFFLGLCYGACGGIGSTYNLYPKLFLRIYEAVQRGDLARGLELQHLLNEFTHVAWKIHIRPVTEHLMRERGFGPRCFRRPRIEMDRDKLKKIEPELTDVVKRIEAIA
jgi:N-acetylneuraminate lyase